MLPLGAYLLKPVQRVLKYALFLEVRACVFVCACVHVCVWLFIFHIYLYVQGLFTVYADIRTVKHTNNSSFVYYYYRRLMIV